MIMWILSLISFLLLGGFLLLSAMRYGVPDMVSDTYYQLQGTTGSEVLGGKTKRNFGWVFSVVMVLVALLMMVSILDLDKGLQCLAFIGCGGLAFVGCAPNYLGDESKVHKIAALVAAAANPAALLQEPFFCRKVQQLCLHQPSYSCF